MEDKGVTLTFHGGTQGPTGSNFLLVDHNKNISVLVDSGLVQGQKLGEDLNRKKFSYNPKDIDYLFITHAHIDHIGLIPKLVGDGFSGTIYSTAPTKDIAERMLVDSLGVLEKEARKDDKPPLYTKEDVNKAINLWKKLPYHESLTLGDFHIKLLDAGHILGSSMVQFTYRGKTILFTGDLGNAPAPLLRDAEKITGTHTLIMESVYGDRDHENRENRKQLLEDIIEDSVRRGGALMIPAFSLERTQELLFEINDLIESGRIPKVPIFIDSPLAIDVTEIYKKYTSLFNVSAQDRIRGGDDIFHFQGLSFTYDTKESKAIKDTPNPKIIIAGSGMSNGGRIVHHEKMYLSDPKSTLLIIGYQVPGSLGRKLQDGEKNVTIFNEKIRVRARIETIRGYSAHMDSESLLEFVATSADSLEQVYVVLGEPKARLSLVQKIRDHLGIHAFAPSEGETIKLS